MKTPYECPKCKADLKGEKIPDEHRKNYAPETEYFSRAIGVYDEDADRTTHWCCPECNHRWERK